MPKRPRALTVEVGPYSQEAFSRAFRLRESAATETKPVEGSGVSAEGQPTFLRESITHALTEAPTASGGGMVVDLVLIEAGWNSSGSRYYPPEVLARDVPTAFPKGTHQHWDHQSLSESVDRPERSLTTLAAVLVEDPYTVDGGRTMRAKARVYAPYQESVREMWRDIGVSIDAEGAAAYGEVEGRSGLIVESISRGNSIDYVTRAGAGGKVLALLESARSSPLREARTLGGWLESRLHLVLTQYADDMYGDGRLTREERITLSSAIGDGLQAWTARVEAEAPDLFRRDLYDQPPAPAAAALSEASTDDQRRALTDAVTATHSNGGDTYVWVRDWDPDQSVVWFDVAEPDQARTYQQSYTLTGDPPTAALTGDATQVLIRTVYTPALADTSSESADTQDTSTAEGTTPTITEAEEGVMPEDDTKLREAEQARITAETKLAEALRRAEEAENRSAQAARELAAVRAVEAARPIAVEALTESGLPAAAQARVLAAVTRDVPLTEAGGLNEDRLRTSVAAEIKAESAYLATLQEAAGVGQVSGMGATTSSGGGGGGDREGAVSMLVEAYKARGMSPEAAKLAATGRAF